MVFVGNHDGLFALGTDGEVRWSHDVSPNPGYSGVFRSPAVVDGTVYFTDAGERSLFAYSIDGERKWHYDVDGRPLGGPAVADGQVYVADDETGVHALTADGDHRWTASVGAVEATPTVVDGTVYVVGYTESAGNFLAAIDAETGRLEWLTDRGPSYVGSSAVVRDELACPTWHGGVFTYARESGALTWGSSFSGRSPTTLVVPASDGRRVFVAGDDVVAAVEPWNDRLWQVELDGARGGIAVTDGALFVGSTGGQVVALA